MNQITKVLRWVKNFQHPRSMFVVGEFLVKLTEPNYRALNLDRTESNMSSKLNSNRMLGSIWVI